MEQAIGIPDDLSSKNETIVIVANGEASGSQYHSGVRVGSGQIPPQPQEKVVDDRVVDDIFDSTDQDEIRDPEEAGYSKDKRMPRSSATSVPDASRPSLSTAPGPPGLVTDLGCGRLVQAAAARHPLWGDRVVTRPGEGQSPKSSPHREPPQNSTVECQFTVAQDK